VKQVSKATLVVVRVMACILLAAVLGYVPRLRSYGFADGS
jgi:hypothetical protein